jgi:hypothetical protein
MSHIEIKNEITVQQTITSISCIIIWFDGAWQIFKCDFLQRIISGRPEVKAVRTPSFENVPSSLVNAPDT